jgi:hypothetical protein
LLVAGNGERRTALSVVYELPVTSNWQLATSNYYGIG